MNGLFDESAAQTVFGRYQQNGDVQELDALLRLSIPMLEAILCKKLGRITAEYDELRAYALVRLSKGLTAHYDPRRGTMFAFVSKLVENSLFDLFRRKVAKDKYFTALDDSLLARQSTNGAEHVHVLRDIVFKVMQVRTVFDD